MAVVNGADAVNQSSQKGEPLIIGIGASAGGLEALQQFFQHMPSNSGLSFVVVQHLSPDYRSLMADILGKHTEMKVMQAENETSIHKNTVYLIPPKNNMTLKGGKLLLTEFVNALSIIPSMCFLAPWPRNRKTGPLPLLCLEPVRMGREASKRSKSTADL